MKWILVIVVVVLGGLFFNGVYTAKEQLKSGVSLMGIAATYNSMNPISQFGYKWVLRDNHQVQQAVRTMNESLDGMKNATD